jgi:CHAD domain-containing protein
MAEAVLDLEIATLRRDLRAVVARGSERLFTVLLRFRDARDRQAGKLLSEMEALGDRLDAEALHRLRIRCRRLRYLGELAASLKGQPAEAAAIGVFKQLQDRLGEIHDAHVLAGWLEAQAGAARRRGLVGLADEAAAQQAWFLERTRSLHREYLAGSPIEMATRGIQALGGARSAA